MKRHISTSIMTFFLVLFIAAGLVQAQSATDPDPADGAVGISPVAPALSAVVTNPDQTTAGVTFYGRKKPSFSIAVLPDTQFYSEDYPEIFDMQTQWIVDNAAARNIVFVTHEGDITQHSDVQLEWDRAKASMSLLDGSVPYAVLAGNHDDMAWFNDYFPYNQYSNDGHWPATGNDNNYALVSAGGVDFVIISLSYNPDDSAISWADGVLKANPDRIGIIVTHAYMGYSGEIVSEGQKIYDVLVQDNSNVYFVLCGHNHTEYTVTETINGHAVHQLLADYQDELMGGNGWLRIMTFVPSEDRVYVETYSPYLDQYQSDGNSEFFLDLPMPDTSTGYELLGTDTVETGTGVASATWPHNLELGTGYEWYVNVDGSDGPVWSFTTTSSNTTVTLDSPVNVTLSQNPVTFTVSASCLMGELQSATLYLGSPAQIEDAQISFDSPNTNMGEAASINVDGLSPYADALIKFPGIFGNGSNQVPSGATIESAILSLYCFNSGNAMTFYQISEDWYEATVTANTAPTYYSNPSVVTAEFVTDWLDTDITGFVQAWSSGEANYGIYMEDSGTDGVDFYSSEGTTPPVLTVTYTDGDNSVIRTFTAGDGGFSEIETKTMSGQSDTIDFTPQYLGDGDYTWNCKVTTAAGEVWAPIDAQFTVDGVDDPPIAVNDTYNMNFTDGTLNVSAAEGVLSNDSDPEGQDLTAVLVSGGTELNFRSDGSFEFTPSAAGSYSFTYQANDGSQNSSIATVMVNVSTHVEVKDVASGETAVEGEVSGDSDYQDTWASEGNVETITEEIIGRNPKVQKSSLEHIWQFNVTGGDSVIFHLKAAAQTTSADEFVFSYSTDAVSYKDLVVVGSDGVDDDFTMPDTISDIIYVRVQDTNGDKAEITLDSVSVDYMCFKSTTSSMPDTEAPAVPVGLFASAGDTQVSLEWDDNNESDLAGYNIYRNGYLLDTVIASSYTDTGLENGNTYSYSVSAFDIFDNESAQCTAVSATPQAQEGQTISVFSVSVVINPGKKYTATATVTVAHVINGATVVGDWYFKGTLRESGASGTTGSNGTAVIQTSFETPAKVGDEFKFVVTDVIFEDYIYDPDNNNQTEGSSTVSN